MVSTASQKYKNDSIKKQQYFNTLAANCDSMPHYIGLVHLMPIHPSIGSVGYVMDEIFQKAHGK